MPWDFTDGAFPAYWRRPAAYLDERVRRTCSAASRGLTRLRRDLDSGRWHERHADLLRRDEIDAGFRLTTANG